MPRRRVISKRDVPPDPIYNSPVVTKFIRTVMKSGKRSTAEGIVYRSLDIVKEKTGDDPLKVFKKAIDNVKPSLEVKSRRVGGSNYQIPIEVNPNRRLSLSIRWLSSSALSRATVRQCTISSPTSCSMLRIYAEALLRREKIRTGWQRRIRRSPTTGGRRPASWFCSVLIPGRSAAADQCLGKSSSARYEISASWLTLMQGRRRRLSESFSIRELPTRLAKCTKGLR